MSNKEYIEFARNEVQVVKQKLFDELRSGPDGHIMARLVEPIVNALMTTTLVLELIEHPLNKVMAAELFSRLTSEIVDLVVQANSADKETGRIALDHAIRMHKAMNDLMNEMAKNAPPSAKPVSSANVEDIFEDILRLIQRVQKPT